jgi:hypothetical protein
MIDLLLVSVLGLEATEEGIYDSLRFSEVSALSQTRVVVGWGGSPPTRLLSPSVDSQLCLA